MKVRYFAAAIMLLALLACRKANEQSEDPSIKAARDSIKNAIEFPQDPAWRNLTPDVYLGKFNTLASARGIDAIPRFMGKEDNIYVARPNSTEFQRKIEDLVRLGKIKPGHYTHSTAIALTTNPDKKVFKISIDASKSDPANNYELNSIIEISNEILNPAATKDDNTKLLYALGMASQNDEKTTGRTLAIARNGGNFICLHNHQSQRVACVITALK